MSPSINIRFDTVIILHAQDGFVNRKLSGVHIQSSAAAMGIFCCFRFLSSNSPTNLQWILKKLPVSFKVNPARRRAVETESALYYLTSKSLNFGGRIASSLRCALNSALTGYEYGGIRALPKSVIHAGILEGEANGLFHLSGIQAGPDRRWAGARPSGWKSPAPPVCPSCPRRACRSYRLYSSRPTPHRFRRAGLLLKVSFLFFRTPRTAPARRRSVIPSRTGVGVYCRYTLRSPWRRPPAAGWPPRNPPCSQAGSLPESRASPGDIP